MKTFCLAAVIAGMVLSAHGRIAQGLGPPFVISLWTKTSIAGRNTASCAVQRPNLNQPAQPFPRCPDAE